MIFINKFKINKKKIKFGAGDVWYFCGVFGCGGSLRININIRTNYFNQKNS
jgi:hypothetical protein